MEKKKMSRAGLEALKSKLSHLITVERPEIANKLKEARSYGDLSENAEYDEARREQQDLEAQIAELQYAIDNAEVVEDDNISIDEVGVGVTMTIRKIGTDKTERLDIVGTNEVNILQHKISEESPIGKAAMKKKVGDIFLVMSPGGEVEYEVVEIARQGELSESEE